MNEVQARSVLKSDKDADAGKLTEQAEHEVFDIKNFVLRSAPVPRLYNAKRKKLLKIHRALSFLANGDPLDEADRKRFGSLSSNLDLSLPDFNKAKEQLKLNDDDEISELFTRYEAEMTQAQFMFSSSRSGSYAAHFLGEMITVEQAFQSVIIHFFNRATDQLFEYADREVKQTQHTLSSDIKRSMEQAIPSSGKVSDTPAEVSGSDRDKHLLGTELYRLHKINKINK